MTRVDFSDKALKWYNDEDIVGLIEAIENKEDLVELNLSGNILNNNTAKILSKALENKGKLKTLYLNDLFTGRGYDVIRESLESIFDALNTSGAKLNTLNLSDNALGHRGMSVLSKILTSSCGNDLEHLIINNNGIGIHGAEKFCFVISEWLNKLEDEGLECKLKTLEIGRNRLEDRGAEFICGPLKRFKSLRNLQIYQNAIGSTGINHIADALKSIPNLHVLNLNDNMLLEEGSETLAPVLTKMSELKVLDIGDCLIRDHGARIILPAISKLPLKKLDLGFNELSGQIGCDALELIRSMKSFETLILDGFLCHYVGNEFGDTWIEKIKELKQHKDFEFFSISIKEDEGISDVSELELVEALEKTNL